jgi:hypothetical protein
MAALLAEPLVRTPQRAPIPFGEHLGAIDTFDQVLRLERRHRALEILEEVYLPARLQPGEAFIRMVEGEGHSASRMNEQFAARLVSGFLIPDRNRSREVLQQLVPSTSDEELATLVNDRQFDAMHADVHDILAIEHADRVEEIRERLGASGAYHRADRHAFDRFSALPDQPGSIPNELVVRIPPVHYARVLRLARWSGDGQVPVLERLKNDRCLAVGPFEEAKASLVVHDAIDHMWFLSTLEHQGILDRYADVLERVGNAGVAQPFGRESEMLASIAFGVRYRHAMQHGLSSIVAPERLLSLLMRSEDPRTERAKALLRVMCRLDQARVGAPRRRLPLEYHSLGFAFGNYLTELDEQRRKHGKIKVFDGDGVIGELNPLGPTFVALFVEAHHEIVRPTNKHLDCLAKCQIMLEDFLVSAAHAERADQRFEITLTPNGIRSYNPRTAQLPDERVHWIREHPGFLASKRSLTR